MPVTWGQCFYDLNVHYCYRLDKDYQFSPRTRRNPGKIVEHKLKSGASHLFAAQEVSKLHNGEIGIRIRAGAEFQPPNLPALEELVPPHLEAKWSTDRRKMSNPGGNEFSAAMQTQSSWYSDNGDMITAFVNFAATRDGLLRKSDESAARLGCFVETEVKQGTALGDILMRPDIGMTVLDLPVDSPEWCQVTEKLTSAQLAALLEFKSYRVFDNRLLRAMAVFCKEQGIATCHLSSNGKVSFRFPEDWERKHVQGLVNLNLVEVGLIYALENVGYGFHLDVPTPAVTNGNAHYLADFDLTLGDVLVGSPFGYSRDKSRMYPWGTGDVVPANDESRGRPVPVELVFAAQTYEWMESKVKYGEPPSKTKDDGFVAPENDGDEDDDVVMEEGWVDSDFSEDSQSNEDSFFWGEDSVM